MSRLPGTSDTQYVKPTSNVYTALAGAGLLMNLLAFIYLFVRASSILGGKGLL